MKMSKEVLLKLFKETYHGNRIAMINSNYKLIKHVDNKYKSPEVCLEAVKQNGYMLEYITEQQTPEVCLEAVKQNGLALEYVKNQTPEICLEAVKNNGRALAYVKLNLEI